MTARKWIAPFVIAILSVGVAVSVWAINQRPTCEHLPTPKVNAITTVTVGSEATIKVGDTVFAHFECRAGGPLGAPHAVRADVLSTMFTKTVGGNGYAEFRAIAPGSTSVNTGSALRLGPGASAAVSGAYITVEPGP